MVTMHHQSIIRQNSRVPIVVPTADVNTVVNNCHSEDLTVAIVDPVIVSKSLYRNVKIYPLIMTEQKRHIKDLLEKDATFFSDILGKSKTVKHHIRLMSDIP